jgi:hypothetical protein
MANLFDPTTGSITQLADDDPRLTARMPVRKERRAMPLHLHLDAHTPADVTVERLEDRSVFTPHTVAGARWLTTHAGYFYTSRLGYVTPNSEDLTSRLVDAGLVVNDRSVQAPTEAL